MYKILLVEDNEMNRDMLSRRLMRKGYAVLMAADGQQGIDMARSEAPDLILMDLSLPARYRRLERDTTAQISPGDGPYPGHRANCPCHGDRSGACDRGGM